jgi:hypothetical protein
MKELLAESSYGKNCHLDLNLVLFNFHKWVEDRDTDIMSYRDQSFVSAVDGTVSIRPKTPWVERKADFDSQDAFLTL